MLKKVLLRFRILFTNICRVIMSFLFITITMSKGSLATGWDIPDATCYVAPAIPQTIHQNEPGVLCYAVSSNLPWILRTVFVLLVPIALVGSYVIYKRRKRKNNTKEEIKKDDE